MLTEIKGMTDRRVKFLAKMGIYDIYSLLTYMPRKYINMDDIAPLGSYADGDTVVAKVRIVDKPTSRYIRKGMNIVDMKVTDGAYTIECFWFNQPYIAKKDTSVEYFLIGKMTVQNGKKRFNSPALEPVESALTGIVPIYSLTKGFRQKEFRTLVINGIDYVKRNRILLDLTEYHMDIVSAIEQLHFPHDEEARSNAILQLKYDEAVYLACAFDLMTVNSRSAPITSDMYSVNEFTQMLPFELTASQKRAIDELSFDMDKEKPMNRLLQGNVGCGKTIVAVFALYANMKNGYQSAFMSPTEVLAQQNFKSVTKYLKHCNVALLLGSTPTEEKKRIKTGLKSGEIDIVVGTHSLIQDSVNFNSLNLVITDEQHRFGVKQRAKLSSFGGHTLIMSATPIPRTLALIAFDKLNITVIDEMPKGREPVSTHIIHPHKREDMYRFIYDNCKSGRQAYVVCPLIDKSEAVDAKSAKEIYTQLKSTYLKGLNVALLHGRMKAAEKEDVLNSFRDGKVDVLVSTTVIEVGVDVKNATMMVIENSDRFGLAALHQLRGRVGRGSEKSYCFACVDTDVVNDRLTAFKNTMDGLEIAKMDLTQRGMGDLIGTDQHGGNVLKFIDLTKDKDILENAKKYIRRADKDTYNAVKKQTLRIYDNILEDIILN